MSYKELQDAKRQAVVDLRSLLTQASYGNIYDHLLERFIDSLIKILNLPKQE
jgi:hypothetical protein